MRRTRKQSKEDAGCGRHRLHGTNQLLWPVLLPLLHTDRTQLYYCLCSPVLLQALPLTTCSYVCLHAMQSQKEWNGRLKTTY